MARKTQNKRNKNYRLKAGDLVTLGKIGKINSLVLWATWNDADYLTMETKFWPAIIGDFKLGEVALVLEISIPPVGPGGAKLCAPRSLIGWINCRCLQKLDGDSAET